MRRKELVPVELDGAGKSSTGRGPRCSSDRSSPAATSCTSSLRSIRWSSAQAAAAFFDYEHRFEAYVPKEKRVFGYFAQPVLVGDEIVAVLDLKTDRERRKAAGAEVDLDAARARRALQKQIEEALHRFERFQLAR